jgi:hypothetical protein
MARDDNTAAEGGKADHDEHRGTIHFDTVLESEHEAINARREGKSRSHIQSESSGTGSRDPVYDALSGGGIRSAVELQPHILNGLMTKHAAAINGVPGASLMALSASQRSQACLATSSLGS